MLYFTHRYLLGIAALAFLAITAATFLPLFNPEKYVSLSNPNTFVPILDMFIITTAAVTILAITSVLPFITDGKETLYMETPIAHPGMQANLLIILTLGSLYFYMTTYLTNTPLPEWQVERRVEACLFLIYVSLVSSFAITIAFYSMKSKSKEHIILKKQNKQNKKAPS